LKGDATFLQRLLVGWTSSSGVKIGSVQREGTGQTFAVIRYERGSMSVACKLQLWNNEPAMSLPAARQPSPEEGRKSTVRKPSALSEKLANDFENGPVHNSAD
jgi:hypothetical protein